MRKTEKKSGSQNRFMQTYVDTQLSFVKVLSQTKNSIGHFGNTNSLKLSAWDQMIAMYTRYSINKSDKQERHGYFITKSKVVKQENPEQYLPLP